MRLALLTLALVLVVPAVALASGRDVIRDCTDDERFTKTYTQQEYREALEQLSADTDEYTNCRAVIRRAQLSAAGGGSDRDAAGGSAGGGAAGGGGSAAPGVAPSAVSGAAEAPPRPGAEPEETASPRERAALDAARTPTIDPTRAGAVPGVEEDNDLPTAVVLLLVALGLAALGLGATRLRTLVRTRRNG